MCVIAAFCTVCSVLETTIRCCRDQSLAEVGKGLSSKTSITRIIQSCCILIESVLDCPGTGCLKFHFLRVNLPFHVARALVVDRLMLRTAQCFETSTVLLNFGIAHELLDTTVQPIAAISQCFPASFTSLA